MKKKILLFISLVLLAVQGWATPVDSLKTHITKLDSIHQWHRFELSDSLIPFDGFVRPGFNPDDYEKIDDNHRGIVIPAVFAIADLVKSMAPIVNIFEVDESNPFSDVTVGTSVSKKYEIWGHNVFSTAEAIRTSDKVLRRIRRQFGIPVTPEILSYKIRLCLTPLSVESTTGTNLDGLLGAAMFSLDNTSIRPSDIDVDEGADRKVLTVTYNPTLSGTHKFRFVAMYEFYIDGVLYPDLLTLVPIVNTTGLIEYTGTAVERHLTAGALSSFRTLTVGESDTIPIHVEGINLNGPVTVTLDDHYSNNDMFSIDKLSLDPDATGAINDDVMLIYTPTAVGTHGVSVDVSGGGALGVASVVLTGHCEPPTHIITVDKSLLNFGTVVKGETSSPKSFNVKGTNLTNDLVLSLSPECSHYTISPTRISPDEAAEGKLVTVTYHPSIAGTHNVSLTINEEGQLNGGQIVSLNGKCVANPTITVNKTSLDFTPIEAGKTAKQTIIVTGSDLAGSISVKLEETVSGQFSINKETLPASGGSVVVTYHPTEGGSHGGCVRISATGATAVPVTVSGSARELSVSKTSLNFGTIKKTDAPPKQKFTVYGKNLTGNVTLTSSNSRFTVSPASITPEEAKAGKEVTVTYTPTTGGTHSGKIIVSASGVTSDTISVSGKCAAISPNPTSYNFGNVAVGKPVTKEITITGTNLTSAMSITLAETEGGQYSINKTTLPASGGTVIVTFKPTDAKSFGASLNISGGSASAVSVSLTGKGVTPTITRNKSTLTFTGSSITSDYVKVTGTNLDDVISLEVTGSGKTHFTLSTNTISISDAADGKQVKVTCNPKNATSAEATLKISSPYASTKYVTLKYSRGSSGGGEVQVSAVQPEGGDEDTNNEFTNGGSLDVMNGFTTEVNELAMNSKVYAEGLNIIIESPVEQNAIISDISGRARSVNLQAGRNEIPVNASGIYIVRIREKTTKLMLK